MSKLGNTNHRLSLRELNYLFSDTRIKREERIELLESLADKIKDMISTLKANLPTEEEE